MYDHTAYNYWLHTQTEPELVLNSCGGQPRTKGGVLPKMEFDIERERFYKETDDEKNFYNDEYLKKFGL